jgi:hypothetical protein
MYFPFAEAIMRMAVTTPVAPFQEGLRDLQSLRAFNIPPNLNRP